MESETLRFCVLWICVFFFVIGSDLRAQTVQDSSFVSRRGKATVQSYCLPCHSLSAITDVRLKPDEWNEVMEEMVEIGMKVSPETRRIIYAYLVEHYSPIETRPERSQPEQTKKPPTERTKPDRKPFVEKPGESIETGKRIYKDFGCDNCHKLNGQGAKGLPGPELGNVGSVLCREMIAKKLRDTKVFYTEGFKQQYDEGRMPLFELTDQERNALAVYLSSLRNSNFKTPRGIFPDGKPVLEP